MKSGKICLCFVFLIALSNTRINEGSTVIHAITPSITPLAITIPRSSPNVKLIKHNAINPATVVIELPTTDEIVACMARAIAFLLSPLFNSNCSS